jgi:hypothetical protein
MWFCQEKYVYNVHVEAGHWCLKPVIPVTWEAEIRSMEVRGQPRQTVYEPSISKITRAKWIGGVAEGVERLLCSTKT